jgi:hypothetical protein
LAEQKGLTEDYRLSFPATRADVERLYPSMSTKAKKHLTALRVKRKRAPKQQESGKGVEYSRA